VFGGGATPNKCVADVRQALTGAVALMLEQGESPPAPATERKRTAQVNIRLTPEEKLRLEEAARRDGFRGLSDYIRTTTLANTV